MMTAPTLESERMMNHDPSALLVHADFLRRVAIGLLGDETLADDAVQQTWIKAMRRRPSQPSKVRAWLASVTRNEARNILRGAARRSTRERSASRSEVVLSASDIAERERIRREVVDSIMKLREEYREVLLLRYYEDLPPREIANRLGVSSETVRTRIRRATEAMRSRLDRTHESREAWRAALLPLAVPIGAREAAVAGGAGVFALGAKTLVAATSAAVLLVAAIVWLLTTSGDSSRDSSRNLRDAVVAQSDANAVADSSGTVESSSSNGFVATSNATERGRDSVAEAAGSGERDRAVSGAASTSAIGASPGVAGRIANPEQVALADHPLQLLTVRGTKLADFAALMLSTDALADAPVDAVEVHTGNDGQFRFAPLVPGMHVLSARATDGYPVRMLAWIFVGITDLPVEAAGLLERGVNEGGLGVKVAVLEEAEVRRLDLELPRGRKLFGRVVDENGRPVAGANLRCASEEILRDTTVLMEDRYSPMFEAVTDPNGEFEIAGALGGTGIGVIADGYEPIVHTVTVAPPAPDDEVSTLDDLTVFASDDWHVVGRVVGRDGPIAGASISRLDRDDTYAPISVTDESGAFDAAFAQRQGTAAMLRFSAAGHASADVVIPRPDAEDCRNLQIRLEPMGELAVRLLDEKQQPIAGGSVRFATTPRTADSFKKFPTNESGIASFAAPPPGPMTITAGHVGYETETLDLDLTSGVPDGTVDVTLRPVSWQIVVETRTPDGSAVPTKLRWPGLGRDLEYFSLHVVSKDPTDLLAARGIPVVYPGHTVSDRTIKLTDLEAGSKLLRLPESWSADAVGWIILEVAGQEPVIRRFDRSTESVLFTIDPDAVRRSTAVVGAVSQSRNLPGAMLSEVVLHDPDGYRLRNVETSPMPLLIGARHFIVHRPGLYRAMLRDGGKAGVADFQVELGRATIAKVPTEAASTVAGQVVQVGDDSGEGQTVATAGSRLSAPVVQLLDEKGHLYATSRSRDGSFEFEGVLPGDYSLRVRKPGHGMTTLPIRVEAGKSKENLRVEVARSPIVDLYIGGKRLGGVLKPDGFWELRASNAPCLITDSPLVLASPMRLYRGPLAPGRYELTLVTEQTGRVKLDFTVGTETTRIDLDAG